jgi:hypothetical protein
MISPLLNLEHDLPTTAEDIEAQRHDEAPHLSFEAYLEWLDQLGVRRLPRPESNVHSAPFELPRAKEMHP